MKERRQSYNNNIAANYEKERIETKQWKEEQKIVEGYIKKIKPISVLDIPVGTGRFFGKYKTTGVDVSLDMLEIAEGKMGKDDKVILGDIFNIDYNSKFDVVISMRFLNWITTEELTEVMKNLSNATSKYLILGIHLEDGQKGEVFFHKEEDIEELFKKNRLKVLEKKLAREDKYYIFLLEKEPRLTVSYNIMAHPKRKEYIPYLLEKLGDVKVIWDTQNNIWHTRKKCLKDHIKQGKDIGITIQDDSIVCDDFKEKAEEFINSIGDANAVYNFFYAQRLDRNAIDDAIASKNNYIKFNRIMNEICFGFPTHLMQEMMDVCDNPKNKKIKPEGYNSTQNEADWVMDYRYLYKKDTTVYFSLPSLIDHRCPDTSLYYTEESIRWTGKDLRTCWWFIGDEWKREVLIVKERQKTPGRKFKLVNGQIVPK